MILCIDFESAFGKSPTGRDVTLSKLTTEEYVRDPEFKIHGLGVKLNDRPAKYIYKKDELIKFLKTFPWHQAYVLAHHAHFDGAILSWLCGIRPKMWLDTLSMARAIYPHESSSLGNISKLLGLGEKGFELMSVKDKWTLTDQEQATLGGYCCNDVELTYKIFQKLKNHFPPSELQLIDQTVRLFTEPVIQVDPEPLIADFKREKRRKRALIKECSATKTELASNDQFAEILLTAGVDPPKKLSPSKVKDGRVDPDEAGDPPMGLLPAFKSPKKPAKRSFLTDEDYQAAIAAWEAEKARIKEEKNKYPWAYAFGKSDEEFKLLLDHPDTRIQALVEARMGVKSTIKETRSKRFYKIGKRGAFPVYLLYYGAHTGRFSGGDKQNAQNLTRANPDDPESGALRKSWIAPEGHVVVVRDLSQIEARMLAYIAGQEDVLDMFRAGGDPYCYAASNVYGREITKKDKDERQVGKIIVLGCFAADTKVLTDSGWKSIVCVTDTDLLWDGVEWVAHQGVIYQGVKECQTAHGLTATPDHEILTEHGWEEWEEVHTKSSLFRSARRLANSLLLNGSTTKEGGIPSSDVLVGGRGESTEAISRAAKLRDVIRALSKRLRSGLRSTTGTPIYCQMTNTEFAYLTESAPVSQDAMEKLRSTETTQPEGSRCSRNGVTALSGAENSSAIYSPLRGGTTQPWKSTVLIIMKGIVRAISGLLREGRTCVTAGQSKVYKKRLMTYDIAFAGPRSRFTVATDAGPIIVHNCGYQMGAGKLQESVRVGFMGMPGFIFDEAYVNQLGVDVESIALGRSYKKGYALLRDEWVACKPLNVSEEDHITHCAVTKFLVDGFRNTNPKVRRLWEECKNMLPYILNGDELPLGEKDLITTCKDALLMPNGMKIRYNNLRLSTSDEKTYKYLANKKKKEWTKIYGGKMTENIVQALSRTVLTDQMQVINKRLTNLTLRAGEICKTVTTTHDEIVVIAPERLAQTVYQIMGEEMGRAPAWCADLPLKSSGGFAKNYGDCEK